MTGEIGFVFEQSHFQKQGLSGWCCVLYVRFEIGFVRREFFLFRPQSQSRFIGTPETQSAEVGVGHQEKP
jgi:hypothetical protein